MTTTLDLNELQADWSPGRAACGTQRPPRRTFAVNTCNFHDDCEMANMLSSARPHGVMHCYADDCSHDHEGDT